MTLGASRCGQCVGQVSIVTGSSGCDQWVGPVSVVSGDKYTIYHIMLFDNRIPTFSSIFVNYFSFLFLFHFLDFSTFIRERMILEDFQHLAIRGVHQGQ